MAVKPSIETILQTFSLDELLDLVKLKSFRDKEETLDAMKKHLESFIHGKSDSSVSAAEIEKEKTRQPKPPAPAEKPTTLSDYVLDVMGAKPLRINEIMEAIFSKGYKSQSKEPKQLLIVELTKLIKKNILKKVKPGVYVRK